MSRTLDFNSIERPTLDVTMKDEARTVVRVSAPTEGLVERLEALKPTIAKMKKNSSSAVLFNQVFDFFAKILSNNEDRLEITAEDIRDKYKLTLVDFFIFYSAYMAFIEDIKTAKN